MILVRAIKLVLTDGKYALSFVVFSIVLFWLFLAIPVITIPGNDVAFQLSILGAQGMLLLALLSALTSLLVTFHIYILKHKTSVQASASMVGQGGTGFLSGAIATVFGTASCASCVSSLFGFLGVGGVLFLVQYRTPITIGAIALLIISLYFTSRKVLGVCEDCRDLRKHKNHP